MTNASAKASGSVNNVIVYNAGRSLEISEADKDFYEGLGFKEKSDAVDLCPNCGKVMGFKDGSDAPGDRWTCPGCEMIFCHECYGTGFLHPKGHVCNPKPMDMSRLIEG